MLNGKVIIVTGALGKLGYSFVTTVLENGAKVVLADINDKLGKEKVLELSDKFDSFNIIYENVDITSKSSLDTMIRRVEKRFFKIDALVNAAYPRGKEYGKDFLEVEYMDLCENINLHLGGYLLTSQRLSKYFLRQGYGNIINIASVYGSVIPDFNMYKDFDKGLPIEYVAVKSALLHTTKYLAKLFEGKIRVNSISPGGIINSENQSLEWREEYQKYCLSKGMIDREDISGTLLYLLSDMSKFVNGQDIIIDDGYTL